MMAARASHENLALTRAHWGAARTQAHLAGWVEARGLGLEVHESDRIVDAAFDAVRELFGEMVPAATQVRGLACRY